MCVQAFVHRTAALVAEYPTILQVLVCAAVRLLRGARGSAPVKSFADLQVRGVFPFALSIRSCVLVAVASFQCETDPTPTQLHHS